MIEQTVETELQKALERFPHTIRDLLLDAAHRVIELHTNQPPRPSGELYPNHVVRVAARIVNEFDIVDKDIFIAALFHDTIEDQLDGLVGHKEATRDEAYVLLAKQYSPRVSEIVRAMTNTVAYEACTDPVEKQQLYEQHVVEEASRSNDCFVVKLSDFLDNAMQLQRNLTDKSRIHGAKKYRPIFTYLEETLLSDRELPLSLEVRKSIAETLHRQSLYVADLLS